MQPDHRLLAQFGARAGRHIAETEIADVWQVMRHDGTPAALKIYRNGNLQDESPGIDLLAAANGQGAAKILARRGPAVLMEWLDGPSLGDMVRKGDDETASLELVAVAKRLHQASQSNVAGLDPLPNRFRALQGARFASDCPASAQDTIRRAAQLAQHLLAGQTHIRPLHGDLHHDNIMRGARGYVAIDAKGVLGEPAYELANAFRNPVGAEETHQAPDVIMRRARQWAHGFGVAQRHLLRWAAAHAALSLCWTHNGVFDATNAHDVASVDRLLSCVVQSPVVPRQT